MGVLGWIDEERRGTDEEVAIRVFELSEEDGDEGIAIHVVYVTFSEKDVSFVKEEYGRLCGGILEDLL